MALLLVLMFVLTLGSQVLIYALADDLGRSDELRARHGELARELKHCQEELDALEGTAHSAGQRFTLLARQSELIATQIETDSSLLESCESQCKWLSKALNELLTAANDEEVILECGQEELEQRTAQVREQHATMKKERKELKQRLESERQALAQNEAASVAVMSELQGDETYRQELEALAAVDQDLEADVLDKEEEARTLRTLDLSWHRASGSEKSKDSDERAEEADSGIDGREVVSFALQFVGNPYRWSGESLTEGCDCSGFIKGVFDRFGIELPHFSGALQHAGVAVAYDDVQLGDLICYDGHVGIYMGDDKMVNAFDSKHGIIICAVDAAKLVAVRRIV